MVALGLLMGLASLFGFHLSEGLVLLLLLAMGVSASVVILPRDRLPAALLCWLGCISLLATIDPSSGINRAIKISAGLIFLFVLVLQIGKHWLGSLRTSAGDSR